MLERSIDIIGASGLVGSVVSRDLSKVVNLTPNRDALDICKKDLADGFLSSTKASHVLLMAAYTDVEAAQKNPNIAVNVNVNGTKNVAEACKKHDKHLIYVSTDFVFAGGVDKKGPYLDTSETEHANSDKISEYAKSKLMGEIAVKESGCKYSIVRISYPFGNVDNDKDFASKTINLVKSGYPLFTDQQFTPTYIPDLSKAIYNIVNQNLDGTFHVVCTPVTTPFEFGIYLMEKMGLELEVKQGNLKGFMVGRTPKPLYGGLLPSNDFEVRNWRVAIDEFVKNKNS